MDKELERVKLNPLREKSDFDSAIKKFVENNGESFAIIYTPGECLLLKVGKGAIFQTAKDKIYPKNVFEARVFNKNAELRWFNNEGEGVAVTLSETATTEAFGGDILLINPQKYIVWGKKVEDPKDGWTQFATARIGGFYIPKEINTNYAAITAIEYLKEFEDGNVAVAEERLTGIREL